MATKTTKDVVANLLISPPNFQVAKFKIRGTAPYVQNNFSEKARKAMIETQEAGSTAKKGKKKEAKNFEACYEAAMHKSVKGWHGIPAPAFRNAMISACKIVGFHMTKGKLAVFVEADGFEADGKPLVKITKGKPRRDDSPVRLPNGSFDIHPRPMWDEGWEAMVRVRFDADQFTLGDVANLMLRVGLQVGVGEGRPDSKNSNGVGWGMFELAK
jgi:hypothetical protein